MASQNEEYKYEFLKLDVYKSEVLENPVLFSSFIKKDHMLFLSL